MNKNNSNGAQHGSMVLPAEAIASTPQGTSSAAERPWGYSESTLWPLLRDRAAADGSYPYARAEGVTYTIRDIADRSELMFQGLDSAGVTRGSRVLLLLENSLDFVAILFALCRLGAWAVLGNPQLRGDALRYQIEDIRPDLFIFERRCRDSLAAVVGDDLSGARYIERGTRTLGFAPDLWAGIRRLRTPAFDSPASNPDDIVAVSYTSGTTGLPKGVLLTDRMMRVAAHAASRLSGIRDGDILHCWEPFFHIGGSEVLLMAVQRRITLAMFDGFSVSRFWPQIAQSRATHLHFLGGVLALILKGRDPTDEERASLRAAWGGGSPRDVWRRFEERFGVPVRECYGLTEASSFVSLNLDGPLGSVGTPLPYFEVQIVDDTGQPVPDGSIGELVVRDKVGGLFTPGYWGNPEATAQLIRGSRLHTGDLGYQDPDGYLYFYGRKKDSIRRRGENISAAEVELAIGAHPAVLECAVLGVPNELSDEDVMAVLKLHPGKALEPEHFVAWCEERMPRFHVPRFLRFVEDFPKTPSQRIRKEMLRDTKELAWDRESVPANARGN